MLLYITYYAVLVHKLKMNLVENAFSEVMCLYGRDVTHIYLFE
jgi:hypothetical protein